MNAGATLTIRSRRTAPSVLPRTLSHYELIKAIGNGSAGTVCLARDQRLQRMVAIKILRGWHDPESVQRFLREGRCASAITHPNVVTIFESDSDRGINFIVMEHVAGRTLDRVIPSRGLDLKVCLELALQMARAVAALHACEIIHRDLKPSNFILTKNRVVKLLDFGLAKAIDAAHPRRSRAWQLVETQQGTIAGSPNYMSPEQTRGKAADCRSDVFSFGVVLYEMLTGRRPFQERTFVDTMSAIAQKSMRPLPRNVPTDVADIVRRCLQKAPHQRYKSAAQLSAALMRIVAQLNS